jgi:hypothetical protein
VIKFEVSMGGDSRDEVDAWMSRIRTSKLEGMNVDLGMGARRSVGPDEVDEIGSDRDNVKVGSGNERKDGCYARGPDDKGAGERRLEQSMSEEKL